MVFVFNAAGNGGSPLVVPVGGPPGLRGERGAESTVPGPKGERGRDGTQGPAGAGAVTSREASANVPLWSAVVASDANRCVPADPSNPAHRGQVIGVTAYGGMTGAQVEIQSVGDLLGPLADFPAGVPLFVGAGGTLTSTPPTSGWRQIVATAASSSQIVVALGEASIIETGTALIAEGGYATVTGFSRPLVEAASRKDAYDALGVDVPSGLAPVDAQGRLLGRVGFLLTDDAVGDYLVSGPGTIRASQSPWDPTGAGVSNLRGAQELKYETLYENVNEFGLCIHLRATKGHAAMLAAQPGNDKVAFAPTITAGAGGNNGSCWAFNPIVNAYAGAATDASYFGAEYDLNNFSGKHYGDTAPLEGGGNFVGIIMTGLGVYRKTAGFMVTDVVPRAWNYGYVVPTNCIAVNGSTFADFCSGHRASLDIRGQPDFAIRQVADASRNWLNGRTLIGNYPDAAPQSRLHVEGGAVGGAVGQFIEVFRRNATVDSDSLQMRDTVYRVVSNVAQQGAGTAIFRSGLYRNADAPAVFTDWSTGGTWSLNHGSVGSSIVAYSDLRVSFGGNVDFANVPTADPHVAGRMYRSSGALMISLG